MWRGQRSCGAVVRVWNVRRGGVEMGVASRDCLLYWLMPRPWEWCSQTVRQVADSGLPAVCSPLVTRIECNKPHSCSQLPG